MQSSLNPSRLTLAALLVLSVNAAAQERAGGMLEEVVVTAQKRTESLTDVPISIAVMSSEAIVKTGVRQMREVAEFIPNMSISGGNDSTTAVRIRGVGANTRNIGFDTRAGVYVDGVYMGQSPAQNLDILDLERIEVARGPQGTLFGKNTVAGAINLITRKPSREQELLVTGEMGNYDSYRVSAIGNLPLGKDAAARFSIVDHNRDGFIKNVTTGTRHNEQDGTAMRAQFAFGGEHYDVNIAGDYLESERVSFFGAAISDWSGSVPNTASPGRFNIDNNFDNNEEREIWGLSATVNVDLGSDYNLASITAYRDTSIERRQDTDHSFNDMLFVNYPDAYEQTTQEFQLFSPDSGRLKYVAGLFLYDEKAVSSRQVTIGPDIGIVFQGLAPPLAPFGAAFAGAGVGTFADVDTRSYAAYINGTFDLTERLTLGFGLRYTDEEREVDFDLVGDIVDLGPIQVPGAAVFGVAVGPVVNGQTVANFQDKKDYDDLSPMISLSYALGDDTNLYVKYSEAFKSGGFNVDFVSENALSEGIDFDQETVDAWEIGLKGTALENRLRYNLVAFQMDFEDYQLNQFVQLENNTSAITIRNAAEVSSRGLEAEVTWYPTNNLMLQAAMGYNDAEFDSFPGGASVRNPAGLGADLAGNKLPDAPEWTSALAVQHNLPLAALNADLVTRVDWTYSDSFYATEDNVSFARPGSSLVWGEVDSYSLLNGRIGLEAESWSAYLWGRNILDKEYDQAWTADFLGTVANFPGDPRTYGVEVSYRFL
ncbi:TonB-dependent receptor [Haliea sp. E1-2-M8]|uniref:TonB-dependent receptor n=1 Tax=Haliea sp. E1-2-M8 TaxID=3064706 RepID=UPI002719F3CA|nr:TonB-dependent receptor [Haliea sp. E1-2-M8]MDO8862928.1 TonB-dependent receptor [Haliea sp. E1-2-M8]